ncbi:hypothetical protein [Bradyrhizobium sp. Ghvi]|uniref:hypothetical protein n=1 Tax=Bradyrhizobium sp. Ghvi TaxID=1855319 RepID=UPI0011783CC9|nr:hypothetical protein [Bradyrhizobium sp. Ghvi]
MMLAFSIVPVGVETGVGFPTRLLGAIAATDAFLFLSYGESPYSCDGKQFALHLAPAKAPVKSLDRGRI